MKLRTSAAVLLVALALCASVVHAQNLMISDPMITEGDSGTQLLVFSVTLDGDPPTGAEVTYETVNGSATAGSDYVGVEPTVLSLDAGSADIQITINGDMIVEGTENFFIQLSNATPPINIVAVENPATGTIFDNDTTELSVDDVMVTEGDSGTTNAVFTVSLTNLSANPVNVLVNTADDSAEAPDDYVALAGFQVTVPPLQPSQTFNVPVNGDTTVEPDEQFFVNLSGAVGASIDDGMGIGLIKNDDVTGLSVDDVTVTEGDSGTTDALFTVSLSNPTVTTVTALVRTQDITATAASGDYQARSRTVTFDPGETATSFRVPVNGDETPEADETFNVRLSNPNGAPIVDGVGQGTITNDDESSLSISNAMVDEGDSGTTDMVFTVTLSPASASAVTVDYATRDGSATTASSDYGSTSGSLTFSAGATTRTLTVSVNGDTDVEPDESLFVDLSDPVGATLDDAEGRGDIVNDDEQAPEPGEIRLVSIADVSESAGTATVEVERVGGSDGAASVRARARADTAVAGEDFRLTTRILNWADGEQGRRSFDVAILDDNVEETDEAVRISLDRALGATLGSPSAGDLTILDDDSASGLDAPGDTELTADVNEEVELEVMATRDDGEPVAGTTVEWEVEGESEFVEATTTVTDENGIAAQAFQMPDTPGEVRITARLAGTGTGVVFEIAVEGDLDDAFDPSTSPGESSVAGTLNDGCESAEGSFADACDYLFGLGDEDQRSVLLELTPRDAATAGTLSVETPQVQMENLWLRLAALRGGATRRSVEQLAFNVRGHGVAVGQLATAVSSFELPEETIAEAIDRALDLSQEDEGGGQPASEVALDEDESRLGFFASGRISVGDEPRTDREEGLEIETLGVTAGLDYRVNSHFILGGALGYLDTSSELDGDGGGMDATGYALSMYGTWFGERHYFDGVVSYGRNDYEALRNIDLPVPFEGRTRYGARGSPEGTQLSIGAGGGYDKAVGAATVTGLARVSWIDADVDGYSETGAGPFNLDILDQEVESLLLEGGVEVSWAASYSWGVLQPQLRLSHLHEFEDDSRLIRGRFREDATGGEFAIPTDPPDRDFMNAGAGFTATLTHGRSFYLFYETDLERDDLDLYTISFGFRIEL